MGGPGGAYALEEATGDLNVLLSNDGHALSPFQDGWEGAKSSDRERRREEGTDMESGRCPIGGGVSSGLKRSPTMAHGSGRWLQETRGGRGPGAQRLGRQWEGMCPGAGQSVPSQEWLSVCVCVCWWAGQEHRPQEETADPSPQSLPHWGRLHPWKGV